MLLSGIFMPKVSPLVCRLHHILWRCSSAYSSTHHHTNKTHYDTLGVEKTASKREIRSAFLTLSKRHHPDINKRNDAHKHFMEINEAYNVLHNPASRYQYDMKLFAVKPGAVYAHPPNMASQFYQFDDNYRNMSEEEWARVYHKTMPRRNHGPLILFLFSLMVVGTIGHSVRISASHKQFQKAADEESRRNNLIYNSVRERAANSTVSEQLEKLSRTVQRQQSK